MKRLSMVLKTDVVVLFALLLYGCITRTNYSVDEMLEKTEASTFVASNGTVLPYRMYVSSFHSEIPLILFLHGAGERGNDNKKQLSYGISHIAKFADESLEDAIVLAPQCPCNKYWKSEDIMTALKELLEDKMQLSCVDKSKIYVTGYSMGGEGTWIFGLRNPNLIATLVPLCGGPLVNDKYDYSNVSEDMKGKNIWAFNYFDDDVVDNTYSRYVMSKVWNIETNNMHYTEKMTGGHTAEMYEDKKLMQWMFGTKKH